MAKKTKLPPNTMKVNVYEVLSRAIEEGVSLGYNRAYKHTETPDEETFKEAMELAIMNAICEVFDFGD